MSFFRPFRYATPPRTAARSRPETGFSPAARSRRFRNASVWLVLLVLGSFANQSHLAGQDKNLRFYDNTYVDYIKTVRLHVAGFPHSYPLIELNGSAQLQLSFDDLSDDVRRYAYKFIHCDANWEPSGLSSLEYNSGFAVDYLDDYDFSLRTLKEYIHYDLVFPNRNMQLDVSGNYLLVIYDEEDEAFPVITRRFMVQENLVSVGGQFGRPARIEEVRTHQEIDLQANIKQLEVRNPMRELRATIIQNYRWDNAIVNIAPNMLQRESVRFDYQGKVSFPGTNEYRNLDIRSVQAPRTEVVSITNEGDRYAMLLAADQPRAGQSYLNYFDFNGDFVNFRFDRPVINLADAFLQENFSRFNVDFNGEYVEITFVFATGSELPDPVYIFGGLSEYQLKPELRMVWNPALNAYVARALLKQGFYNYHYVTAVSPERNGSGLQPAYVDTEGSHDNTENDYLALVYWRPVGGRYDRLVGSLRLNSNQ